MPADQAYEKMTATLERRVIDGDTYVPVAGGAITLGSYKKKLDAYLDANGHADAIRSGEYNRKYIPEHVLQDFYRDVIAPESLKDTRDGTASDPVAPSGASADALHQMELRIRERDERIASLERQLAEATKRADEERQRTAEKEEAVRELLERSRQEAEEHAEQLSRMSYALGQRERDVKSLESRSVRALELVERATFTQRIRKTSFMGLLSEAKEVLEDSSDEVLVEE